MREITVIGICAYVGSNVPKILTFIARDIPSIHYCITSDTSLEAIAAKILQSKSTKIHFIEGISTVDQIELLQDTKDGLFKNSNVQFNMIGIQVPWEECFEYLKDQRQIPLNVSGIDWRTEDEKGTYRNNILKCFERIRSTSENAFRIQQETFHQSYGEIVDMIKRL